MLFDQTIIIVLVHQLGFDRVGQQLIEHFDAGLGGADHDNAVEHAG